MKASSDEKTKSQPTELKEVLLNPIVTIREDDRRLFPRVSCSIQARTHYGELGELLDISRGGAFLALSVPPPQSDQLSITFTLLDEDGQGQERTFTMRGRIKRISRLTEGGHGIGLEFIEPTRLDQEVLQRFVLRRVVNDILEVVERQTTELAPTDLKVTQAPQELIELLAEIQQSRREIAIFRRGVGEILSATLKSSDQATLHLELNQLPSLPLSDKPLHISTGSQHYNHYFQSRVVSLEGRVLKIAVPVTIFSYDLRKSPRTPVSSTQMHLEIPLPYPPGALISREILDISKDGLAFRQPAQEFYFLPGTPLRELRLVSNVGAPPIVKSAQVMHVTPIEEQGRVLFLKIGLEFGLHDATVTHGRRPSKEGGAEFGPLGRMAFFLKYLAGKTFSSSKTQAPDALSSPVEVVRYSNRRKEDLIAILNTTSSGDRRLHAPLVIIPPAHGKRKESTSGLALTLLENFKRRRRDLVVMRYDGIRNLGESFKDPDARVPGMEALHWTLSQAVEDLEVSIEYAFNNPRFYPTEVIILSPSLQAIPSRKYLAARPSRPIHHWISLMGVPAAQEVLINTSGGIDYIGNHVQGIQVGVRHLLGMTGNMDDFASDAINKGMAFIGDAQRDLSEIQAPVTWFCGVYDAWVDLASVRQIMGGPSPFSRNLIELQVGHVPLNGLEAVQASSEVVRVVWRSLFSEEIEPVFPPLEEIKRIRQLEWARAPRRKLGDKRGYWQTYLLGNSSTSSGYDVFELSDEYADFIKKEVELLDLKPGHSFADMGCGTGCLEHLLLDRFGGRKIWKLNQITLADFVPGALDRARRKLERVAQHVGLPLPRLETHVLNLQLSPLRVLRRFLDGEFYGYDPLKGVIPGLSDYSVGVWKRLADWRLHGLLRGRVVTPDDLSFLNESLPPLEQAVLLDFNRLARYVRGQMLADDLTDPRRASGGREGINWKDLKFEVLKPTGSDDLTERFPFADESFDRIVCSLVLSYLDNPAETLTEFVRCLKPGGRIVFSSMMPDCDTGLIFLNVLKKVEASENIELPEGMTREGLIDDLRAQLNSVSLLMQIADEGQFIFFSKEELKQLAERAGLPRVEVFPSYGNPPRAYIAVGYKP